MTAPRSRYMCNESCETAHYAKKPCRAYVPCTCTPLGTDEPHCYWCLYTESQHDQTIQRSPTDECTHPTR